MTRIVVADDHALVRAGIRKLLECEPDFQVAGEASTADEAVSLTLALRPDILLLDVAMPGKSGLDALEQVAHLPGLHAVLLTAGVDEAERARAFRLGARGVLLKDAATDLLFDGIRAVMRGDYWLWRAASPVAQSQARPAAAGAGSAAAAVAAGAGGLGDLRQHEPVRPSEEPSRSPTKREREVLKGIVDGCTNREVAMDLGIGEDTVKHHVTSLFNKTGTSTRVELALFALHHHLLDQSDPPG